MAESRLIAHTDQVARHPWPADVFVQGGSKGVVFVRDGQNYRTAFVEAFPAGTFLRGEGETVADAEDACWAKYVRFTQCDGGGQHGPYEPRHYTNGAGFCSKCGTWFMNVCTPSLEHVIEETACVRVKARYGDDVVGTSKWHGLVADEKARLRAAVDGQPEPPATTEPPTDDELRAAAEPLDLSALHAVLTRLGEKNEEVPDA